MIESIIAFAGSATLRWMLGEGIAFFKQRTERKQELEMMRLAHEQDKDRRAWDREAIGLAKEHEITLIHEQSGAQLDNIGAMMQKSAVDGLFTKTGVTWIDGWNGSIRPFLATCAILLIVLEALTLELVRLDETTKSFLFSALGLFVGGRIQRVGR
jgi:hypothetical protein